MTRGRKILKVQELTSEIRNAVERQFSDLWVEGEVSDLKRPVSGHLYFSLKDSTAKIKAVIFRSHVRFLKFIPKDGAFVLIRGHLSIYEARGEYQLICDYIEPRGAGALQAAFEVLKSKLREEGLFDEDRKQPLPTYPARVGLMTSATGAALQDILKVIHGGAAPCHLLVHPVTVQGSGAAMEIAHALDEMNQFSLDHPAESIDLLIVARGGGSIEDLRAFNEETLARAIARSQIPVISAVGHESDFTIADYVADFRAPTPSVAAETVVQLSTAFKETFLSLQTRLIECMKDRLQDARHRIDLALRLLNPPTQQCGYQHQQLEHLDIRLQRAILHLLEEQAARLVRVREGLLHLSPGNQIKGFKKRLDLATIRLSQEGPRIMEDRRGQLEAAMNQLNLLSPLNVLERGYSIARSLPDLSIIRHTNDVSMDDMLEIKLHRGRLNCRVEEKIPESNRTSSTLK